MNGRPPAGDAAPPPARPPRPALVELATALLIVSGVMNLFLSLLAWASLAQGGDEQVSVLVLGVGLAALTIALGIALRYGRWWLLGLNAIAVMAFLELISATPQGLLFGAFDTFVVVVLLVYRPWFAWTPAAAGGDSPP